MKSVFCEIKKLYVCAKDDLIYSLCDVGLIPTLFYVLFFLIVVIIIGPFWFIYQLFHSFNVWTADKFVDYFNRK